MYNLVLSSINIELRKTRKKLLSSDVFYPRLERVVGGYYLELWFSTQGCSFDKVGSCSMCNYGIGREFEDDQIIKDLESYLERLEVKISELMISPSGSLWDKNEVKDSLLVKIYGLANGSKADLFMIETRVDTITEEKLIAFKTSVPHKKLVIEIGLESCNDWILKYLVNKNLSINKYKNRMEKVNKYGIDLYTNISLGTAFLSEQEAINDTVKSINFSFENGSNKVVIFPIHVKPNTFINWLYQRNYYTPVSLWSLVEVLNLIDRKLLSKVEIAWYKSYYDDDSKMVGSPTTCQKCRDIVIVLLDEYRATCSYNVVKKLNNINCSCKEKWKKELLAPKKNLLDRTIEIYKEASKSILGENLHDDFINEIRQEYVD